MSKLHKVLIKLLNTAAKIPTRGSSEAAGRDLYACLEGNTVMIQPHKTYAVPLGFAMAVPKGWVGLIFARSGIAMKKGLRLANGVGVIDSDYRGEWKVLLHNDTDTTQIIEDGERIAQVVFMKYKNVVFFPAKELDATARGEGGFGSTGEK